MSINFGTSQHKISSTPKKSMMLQKEQAKGGIESRKKPEFEFPALPHTSYLKKNPSIG